MTDEQTPAAARSTGNNRSCLIVAGVIVALILATVATIVILARTGGSAASTSEETSARLICQKFVKDRLKAPSTAEFSNEAPIDEGTGHWVIDGDVDAQNSFGAMIRNHYTCAVTTADGGDTWTLASLTGLR